MNYATAKTTEHHNTDELIEHLRQEIKNSTTIQDGLTAITTFLESLDVTIERIILVRNGQTSEATLNENASGIRREFKAHLQNTELTVVCINTITSTLNPILQTLVTSATAAFQDCTALQVQSQLPCNPPTSRMIGDSPQMHQLSLELARAARSNHSVFIEGESGTGKTTAALMLHEQSPRFRRRFVDINCAALPEALLESELFGYERGAFTSAAGTKKGLFEIANGGTLFLDEIGDMKPELQAKLLTAIEGKKIRRLGSTKDVPCDVRIITASSRNIQSMIRTGAFREDLFYRIAVLKITIPPLRERPSDIPALVHHRLSVEQQLAGRSTPYQIAELALKALAFYEWPGNIRELHNIVSRLAARIDSDVPITHQDVLSQLPQQHQLPWETIGGDSIFLPPAARIINPGEDLSAFIARIRLLAIDSTVQATGNDGKAAHRLGYRRSSLVELRTQLMKGNYRGAKTKSLDNPDQPSLPVA